MAMSTWAMLRAKSAVTVHYTDCYSTNFVLIMSLVVLLGGAGVHLTELRGVVNATITVPCDIQSGFDVERVIWVVNSSAEPLLFYIPKDNFISPNNHDPRFSITDPAHLVISRLKKSDTGEYTCRVTSPRPIDDLMSMVNISVLDGCSIWEYGSPLTAISTGCSPGEVIPYAQQCDFYCQQGFRLLGNASTECQGNGQLTNGSPYCEGIYCTIDTLPPHLLDKTKTCRNGSRVRFGTICDFECTAGYSLNGTGTTPVTCDNGEVSVFPKCEVILQETGGQNRRYIALIFFIVLSVLIGIGVCLYLWRCRRKIKDTNCNTPAPVSEQADESELDLIDRHQGFMNLFHQQLDIGSHANMIRILPMLNKAELSLQELPGKKFPCKEPSCKRPSTVSEAFACFVAEVVRCIEQINPEKAYDLQTKIISETGRTGYHRSQTSNEEETDSFIQQDNIECYTSAIDAAYLNLLMVLRNNIDNVEVRVQTTAEVFRISQDMKVHSKQKKITSADSHTRSSKSTSLSGWTKFTAGTGQNEDQYFAELCGNNIEYCDLEDGINLRYSILNIMMKPSATIQRMTMLTDPSDESGLYDDWN